MLTHGKHLRVVQCDRRDANLLALLDHARVLNGSHFVL